MHSVFDDRRYLIPFRATLLPQIFTDVLVIGSGVAGMRTALAATEGAGTDGGANNHGRDVIIAAKGGIDQSCTYLAQGGIAAVLNEQDSFADHIQDTLTAGGGLCDEPVVRRVVEAGPRHIKQLMRWGMAFDQAHDDGVDIQNAPAALGREGGHGKARIVHCDGDATGRALAMTLREQVTVNQRIRLFEDCFVLDLITLGSTPPRCLGAITHHPRYGLQVIWAAATILASGGCGQVFRESTNPQVATGDGLAMAYRAGAKLMDLAFVQFHPTTLYVAGASRSLITEAVRGEGAYLIDRSGHRFMADYDERGELSPRDIVSRSILGQMAKTGHTNVFLDVRHMGKTYFAKRFPGLAALLANFDIDPQRDPIPVHPSAHYMVGGVQTDDAGRTSVSGLYACGEVAATGLHGANRLASNSLLEGLVYGEIVGQTCMEMLDEAGARMPVKIISDIRPSDRSQLDLEDVRSSLRSVMWRHVGIERVGQRLDEVAEMFEFWARYTMDKIHDDREGWEVQNMLTVGALITQAARWRKETRGTHHRGDYPDPDASLRLHDLWQRGQAEPQQAPVQQPQTANATLDGSV